MKKILIFILFSSTLNCFAISWEIVGPCSKGPAYEGQFEANIEVSVGHASVAIFKKNSVPYIGNEVGMNSILNTPTGKEAIEVLSPKKMRAFGWCYRVNGFEPATVASEYFFDHSTDKLLWIYGYSTYDNGTWIGYCDPAYAIMNESSLVAGLCRDKLE